MELEKLTDVQQEATPEEKDAQQVTDTPAESSTETNQSGEAASQGAAPSIPDVNEIPLHKHPRWQELQSANEELKRTVQEQSRYLQGIPQYLDQFRQQLTSKDSPAPDWFQELYGNNPLAWQKYSERQSQERQQLRQEVMQDIQRSQQQEQAMGAYWVNWTNNELKKLKDNGAEFDDEELKGVMRQSMPTDSQGNLNYPEAYRILTLQKQAAKQVEVEKARKKIAAATTSPQGGESGGKDYMTSDELRKQSWNKLT